MITSPLNYSPLRSTPLPSKGFCRLYTTPTIEVNLHKNRRYYVHKEALIRSSPYFEKTPCFLGIEAREGVIRMSDTDDTWVGFELFFEFAYLGDYAFLLYAMGHVESRMHYDLNKNKTLAITTSKRTPT